MVVIICTAHFISHSLVTEVGLGVSLPFPKMLNSIIYLFIFFEK